MMGLVSMPQTTKTTRARFLFRRTGHEPLDFFGGPGVNTRRMNHNSQVAGVNRLEPEKIKVQVSGNRVMDQFAAFRHVKHIMPRP